MSFVRAPLGSTPLRLLPFPKASWEVGITKNGVALDRVGTYDNGVELCLRIPGYPEDRTHQALLQGCAPCPGFKVIGPFFST